MAREDGFIKISRGIEDWEHSDNLAMIGFWVRLLLLANWDGSKKKLKRGELVTTAAILASMCNVSEKTIRRYLKKLVESGEIKMDTTHRKTRIQIINYERYQDGKNYRENRIDGKNYRSSDQNDVQNTDQNNDQNDVQSLPYIKKEKKNIRKEEVEEVGETTAPPTPEMVQEYADSIGYEIDAGYFCDYYGERGWIRKDGTPIADWKATIRNWQRKDKKKGENEKENASTGGDTQKQHFRFKQKPDWLDDDE